jgi:hypothetical protein
MPRQEGGHKQLSYKRAQEQADETVGGGSKGQIELRRKAVEHRRGYLTTTSFIFGDILSRDYRTQQIRAAFDPLIRCPQVALSGQCGGESLRVRRFDGAQPGEKAGERGPKEPPEQAGKHPYRQEEAGLTAHPARPVE